MLSWGNCEKTRGGSYTISTKYYYVLPYPPLSPLFAALVTPRVYNSKEINMIKEIPIETQLDCRATASLRSEIAEDLSKPDRPIADILSKDKEMESDESKNQHNNGD